MDYNKARTFVEIAERGSVSAAAKRLLRSQQAISLQLKALEEEIGLILFDRRGTGIILTQQGQALYESFRGYFAQIDKSVYDLKLEAESMEGTIRIGAWLEQGVSYLPPLLLDFKRRFPGVTFELIMNLDEEIEKLLMANQIDFGFFLFVQDKRVIETKPAIKRSLILVSSHKYLASQKRRVRKIEDTLTLSLVDFAEPLSMYPAWVKKNAPQLGTLAQKLVPGMTVNNLAVLQELILQGAGMSILPADMIIDKLESKVLIPLIPDAKPLEVRIDIGFKRRRTRTYLHDAFLDFVISRL